MNDYKPPCQIAEDPNDWFIERDGRQYSDEPVLTEAAIQAVGDRVIQETGDGEGVFERIEDAIDDATDEKLAANLKARRHAKDACFTDCYMRLQCLSIALGDDPPMYGIYGGYYPEEIRQIRRERDDRQGRRGAVD